MRCKKKISQLVIGTSDISRYFDRSWQTVGQILINFMIKFVKYVKIVKLCQKFILNWKKFGKSCLNVGNV